MASILFRRRPVLDPLEDVAGPAAIAPDASPRLADAPPVGGSNPADVDPLWTPADSPLMDVAQPSIPEQPVPARSNRSVLLEPLAGLGAGTVALGTQIPGGLIRAVGGALNSPGIVRAGESLSDVGKGAIEQSMAPTEPSVLGAISRRDPGGIARSLLYGVGQMVPFMAATMAGGAAGGRVAAGGVARKTLAESLRAGMGAEEASIVAKEAEQAAKLRGARIGAGATSLGIETGSIADEQRDQGINDPLRAVAYALPAAALDSWSALSHLARFPQFQQLRKLSPMLPASRVGAVAVDLLKQGGEEGVTEFLQTLLEKAGAGKNPWSKESLTEALDAGIIGGVGGAATGLPGSIAHTRRENIPGNIPDTASADPAATPVDQTENADRARFDELSAQDEAGTLDAAGRTELDTLARKLDSDFLGPAPGSDPSNPDDPLAPVDVPGSGTTPAVQPAVVPTSPLPVVHNPSDAILERGQGPASAQNRSILEAVASGADPATVTGSVAQPVQPVTQPVQPTAQSVQPPAPVGGIPLGKKTVAVSAARVQALVNSGVPREQALAQAAKEAAETRKEVPPLGPKSEQFRKTFGAVVDYGGTPWSVLGEDRITGSVVLFDDKTGETMIVPPSRLSSSLTPTKKETDHGTQRRTPSEVLTSDTAASGSPGAAASPAAVAPATADPANPRHGATGTLFVAGGESLPFRYELVEDGDIRRAPANDRDYNDPLEQANNLRMIRRFDPALILHNNPTPETGPSIVDLKGEIQGGNRRDIILSHETTYPKYRAELARLAPQFGFSRATVEGMVRPKLVRRITADVGDLNRKLNNTFTGDLHPVDNALSSARLVDDRVAGLAADLFDSSPDSTPLKALQSPKARALSRAMRDVGIIRPQDNLKYLEPGGGFTDFGAILGRYVLLSTVAPNKQTLQAIADTPLETKLLAALPSIFRMRGRGVDVSPMLAAVRREADRMTVPTVKGDTQSIDEYLAQQTLDMGGGPDDSPGVKRLQLILARSTSKDARKIFNKLASIVAPVEAEQGQTLTGSANRASITDLTDADMKSILGDSAKLAFGAIEEPKAPVAPSAPPVVQGSRATDPVNGQPGTDARTGLPTFVSRRVDDATRRAGAAHNRRRISEIESVYPTVEPGRSDASAVRPATAQSASAGLGFRFIGLDTLGLTVGADGSLSSSTLQALKRGQEAHPFLDADAGVVYKLFYLTPDGSLGKTLASKRDASGKWAVDVAPARVRETLEKLAVLHEAGGHPTEIVGLTDARHVLVKQPAATAIENGGMMQRGSAVARIKGVQVPASADLGPDLRVFWDGARAWFIGDLHPGNIMADADGQPAIIDALIGQVPDAMIQDVPEVARAVNDARNKFDGTEEPDLFGGPAVRESSAPYFYSAAPTLEALRANALADLRTFVEGQPEKARAWAWQLAEWMSGDRSARSPVAPVWMKAGDRVAIQDGLKARIRTDGEGGAMMVREGGQLRFSFTPEDVRQAKTPRVETAPSVAPVPAQSPATPARVVGMGDLFDQTPAARTPREDVGATLAEERAAKDVVEAVADEDESPNPQTVDPAPETTATPIPPEAPPSAPSSSSPRKGQVEDFGEKIGGARKDLAEKTGTKAPKAKRPENDMPAWRRPFKVWEEESRDYWQKRGTGRKTGRFVVALVRGNQIAKESRESFATREEAEAFIPLWAVSQQHRAVPYGRNDESTKWGIARELSNGNKPFVKMGFSSRDEAMTWMATHPVEILEHSFPFPERPWLDKLTRTGPARRSGNVTPKMFNDTFGFRGGEFGNWNMGGDGQATLNHAYDALLDFADVLGVSPRALSLNGELAIAFGARGHGLHSARAHYERDYRVINLTKIAGAGAVAHEWFHAFDNYLARLNGQAPNEREADGQRFKLGGDSDMVTNGIQTTRGEIRDGKWHSLPMNLRPALVDAFNAIVRDMTVKSVERKVNPERSSRSLQHSREMLEYHFNGLRKELVSPSEYAKRARKATDAELKQWDALVAEIMAGDAGPSVTVATDGTETEDNALGKRRRLVRIAGYGYSSFQKVRELNALYKAIHGRSFDRSAEGGQTVRLAVSSYVSIFKIAQEEATKEVETATITTDYVRNARDIDYFRASDYWSTKVELGARAFEAHILDKMRASGRQSDYLVYGVENRDYLGTALETPDGQPLKPYPEGAEREAINAAFDRLFRTIEQRDTARGVELFRTPDPQRVIEQADPTSRKHLRSELDRLLGAGVADVSFVRRLFRGGLDRLGSYRDRLVTIVDGQDDGLATVRHEAVHAAEDLLLTDAERSELKQAEPDAEKRAEGFVDYARTHHGPSGRLRALWDILANRIRQFFGQDDGAGTLRSFYGKLLTGYLAQRGMQSAPTAPEQFRPEQGDLFAHLERVGADTPANRERIQREVAAVVNGPALPYLPGFAPFQRMATPRTEIPSVGPQATLPAGATIVRDPDAVAVLRGTATPEQIRKVFGKQQTVSAFMLDHLKDGDIRQIEGMQIQSAQDVWAALWFLRSPVVETMKVMYLDKRNRVISARILNIGALNESIVDIRSMFQFAPENAAGVIISHNHPSGNPAPSSADFYVSGKVADAAQTWGLPVLDHVITNGKTFTSLKADGFGRRFAGITPARTDSNAIPVPVIQSIPATDPNIREQLADWELLPSESAFEIAGPTDATRFVNVLRQNDSSSVYVIGLNTYRNVVGAMQLPPAVLDDGQVARAILRGLPGTNSIIVVAPDAFKESATLLFFARRLKAALNPTGLEVFDVISGGVSMAERRQLTEFGVNDSPTVSEPPRFAASAFDSSPVDVPQGSLTQEVIGRMVKILRREGYDVRSAADAMKLLDGRAERINGTMTFIPGLLKDGVLRSGAWAAAYREATAGAYRRKASAASKREAEAAHTHILRDRVRKLGTTTDLREAGYIRPDGSLVDLSGKRDGGQAGTRSFDHREVGGTAGMQEFMAEGNIRIDANAGTMDLAAAPTTAQLRMIERIVRDHNGAVTVDLQNGLGEFNESAGYYGWNTTPFSYEEGTPARRVLNDIRGFYGMPKFADGWNEIGASPELRGPSVDQVRSAIGKIAANMRGVEVVDAVADLPDADRAMVEQGMAAQGVTGVRGIYMPDGRIILVASGLLDTADALGVLFHETGERGMGLLASLNADAMNRILDGVFAKRMDRVTTYRRAWERVEKAYPGLDRATEQGRRAFAREVLAHIAERRTKMPTLWRTILREIRQFLARLADGTRFAGLFGEATDPQIERMVDLFLRAGANPAGADRVAFATALDRAAQSWAFSAVLRAVEGAKQLKAPGAQWVAWLKNQPGVKAEEIQWLGVNEWLGARSVVTREDLAAFIRANQVEVTETVHGARATGREPILARYSTLTPEQRRDVPGGDFMQPDDWVALNPNDNSYLGSAEGSLTEDQARDEMSMARVDADMDDLQGTRYAQWQLPGGSNYRELLLTLPQAGKDRYDMLSMEATKRPLTESEKRELAVFESAASKRSVFHSGHFSEPNILAHVRFNERTDADGKRVLFIEEIQSDWHQAGREKGYALSEAEKLLVVTPATNADEFARQQELIRRGATAVPDAPFKTTWPLLAMKRMIRWAAENGFDRIAWTTGDQQSYRYNLRKQGIEKIEWETEPINRLMAYDNMGHTVHTQLGVTDKNIAEYVGKEAAAQLLSQTGDERSLTGKSLEVGGFGMRGFYDAILPSEVNKYVKKWGGKVGRTTIPQGTMDTKRIGPENWPEDMPWASLDNGRVSNFWSSKAEAQSAVDRGDADEVMERSTALGGATVHSLDITPAMRAAALAGDQPLFAASNRGDTAAMDREYLAAVERGDTATAQRMVEEAARAAGFTIGPVYHGGTVTDAFTSQSDAKAFYVTEDVDVAHGFADQWSRGSGRIVPLYLRATKVLDLTDETLFKEWIGDPRGDMRTDRFRLKAEAMLESGSPVLDRIRAAGFDAVKFYDTDVANAGSHVAYAVFLSSSVKQSPDANGGDWWGIPVADGGVTRDDSGNVIPLSKRFNPNSPDIRFAASLPPSDSEMLSESDYRRQLRSTYSNASGTVIRSSRETPADPMGLTLGMWRVDTIRGVYGREVAQLRLLDPSTLSLSENMVERNEEGRGWDAERYAQWFRDGRAAPPIEVVETDGGTLRVVNGHRRVAAAIANGVPVLAWVSPSMDVPSGSRRDGKPDGEIIKTGLTIEAWRDGTAKRTAPLSGGFSDESKQYPDGFPRFAATPPAPEIPVGPDGEPDLDKFFGPTEWPKDLDEADDKARQKRFKAKRGDSESLSIRNALRLGFDTRARKAKFTSQRARLNLMQSDAEGLIALRTFLDTKPSPAMRSRVIRRTLTKMIGNAEYVNLARAVKNSPDRVVEELEAFLNDEISGFYSRRMTWLLGRKEFVEAKLHPDVRAEFRDLVARIPYERFVALRTEIDKLRWYKDGKTVQKSPAELEAQQDAVDLAAQKVADSIADVGWEQVKDWHDSAAGIWARSNDLQYTVRKGIRMDRKSLAAGIQSEIEASAPALNGTDTTKGRAVRGWSEGRFTDVRLNQMGRAEQLSGGNPNGLAAQVLGHDLQDAEVKQLNQERAILTAWKAKQDALGIGDTDWAEWSSDLKEYTLNGQKITLTTAEIMDLYATMLDPENALELTRAPIKLRRLNGLPVGVKFGKDDDAVGILEDFTLKNLTGQQRELTRYMVKALTDMGEGGNLVSRALYGTDLFTKTVYWPRERDITDRSPEALADIDDLRRNRPRMLEHLGLTKERVTNVHGLMLSNAAMKFAQHVHKMTAYTHLTIPVGDALAVLQDGGVGSAIRSRYGSGYISTMRDLFERLAGLRRYSDGWTGVQKFMATIERNASVATLWGRVSTIIFNRVGGSIMTMSELEQRGRGMGAKYLKYLGGPGPLFWQNAENARARDLLLERNGYLWKRWSHDFVQVQANLPIDEAEAVASKYRVWLRKIQEVGMRPMAMAEMKNAVATFRVLVDSGIAEDRAIREVEQIVRATQNPSSAMQETVIYEQVKKSGLGIIFPFLGQPTVAAALFARDMLRLSGASKAGKPTARAARNLALTAGGLFANVVLTAMVRAAFRAATKGEWPPEDPDEEAQRSGLQALAEAMDILLPGSGKALDAVTGLVDRGVARDTSQLGRITEAFSGALRDSAELADGDLDPDRAARAMDRMAQAVSMLTGLPYSGPMQTVKAVAGTSGFPIAQNVGQ